ncbi:hypothetical protein IDG48_03925 [Pelagibacterales bacterium SAG-MED12]|nr:hypothetical protein [Pelagibacterales bacterium SAG-MED12]
MGKNLSFKKIGKQILSINNLIESYFNKLRSFISNPKKFQFTRDNRVILVFTGIVFLTLAYFLIPTAYNKDLIQKEIKNQVFLKYQIRIDFIEEINYGLFPKPHFVAKNLSILNDKKKIAVVNNLKIFIGFKNFFKFDQIQIKDLIFNKLEFNIQKSDLNFFKNILEAEPNRQKLVIKNSSIFFLNKDKEVLFLNQIDNSKFFFDFKNLKNIYSSKNKIFNIPYKITIKNDKLNQTSFTTLVLNKLRLKIENQINYRKENNIGLLKINFKNKSNLINYKLKKNSLDFSLKDSNKTYSGNIEFKPFYMISNLNYQNLKLSDLINNPLLNDIIKTQIISNENLNAEININIKKIVDFDRFKDLFLKLKIEEGDLTFSDSNIKWKESINLSLLEGLINYDEDTINFNGRMLVTIKEKDDLFRYFQINKDLRKPLEKIEFDFNYDIFEKKIFFDNLRIDNKSNDKLDRFIMNFNSSDEKVLNKITFKSFVNNIFLAYFG